MNKLGTSTRNNASSVSVRALLHCVVLAFVLPILIPDLQTAVGQNNVVLYNEDFSAGQGSSFSTNTAGPGSNTGTNQWIINNQYNGLGAFPNTTNQNNTTSGSITSANGNYLHIHDQTSAPSPANANYDPGNSSDRFAAMSSGICTKGFVNVRFSYFWVGVGSASDFVDLYYQKNGGAWTLIGPNPHNNQTQWKYEIIINSIFDDANEIRFGFRWKNNVSNPPSDISFGVDDLFILGDVDLLNPAQITVPTVPVSVCRGTNMVLGYNLSKPLCDGNYSIELLNNNVVVATYGAAINYPTTSGNFAINIPPTVPLGNCYQVRVNRLSPPPQITGSLSACFQVVDCPNDITTLQPVVTIGSETSAGPGVCVGSAMDVPFWSTGTYQPGNVYTAELSDANGNFGSPLTIGTFNTTQAFDPQVVPSPGTVSGQVPATPDGCGYLIRVVSSLPNSIGTTWGPFCIVNCNIETNNREDTSVCISDTAGVTFTMPYSINNAPAANATYANTNQFQIEVLSSMTFGQVNLGGLGSVTSTTSGNITVTIPPLPTLLAMGISPGLYYIRVIATNSSTPNNALGTLVRLTIGAPDDPPPNINASDNLICNGDIVNFTLAPFNPASQYQWFLNGAPFPGPMQPTYPLGILFNGGPGLYIVTVQETNYGCPGNISQPDSIEMLPMPQANINGDPSVCFGDTASYAVSFINNTAYGWSLNPPNTGTININGADEIKIVWDQLDSGLVTLNLDYASNICGSTSGNFPVTISPSPTIDAGADIDLPCAGDTAFINSVTTGGTPGYFTLWTSVPTLFGFTTPNPIAVPLGLGSETYSVTVTDVAGCTGSDEITVTVLADIQVDAGPDIDVCWGDQTVIGGSPTGPSTAQYTWSPGGTLNNANAANPISQPTQTQTYLLTVFDPASTCTKFDSMVINYIDTVFTPLQVIDTCGDAAVPLDAGEAQTYLWNDGSTGRFLIRSQDGTYTVTVTPDNGCDFVNTYSLFNRPMELIYEQIEFCDDEDKVLDAGPAIEYRWDNLDDSRFRTIEQPGGYRVTVTPTGACIYAHKFDVEINPTTSNEVTVLLCESNSVVLDPGPGAAYNWSTNDKTSTITIDHPQHYFVTVTPQNACNHFVFFDVEGLASRDKLSERVICEGDVTQLDAGRGDSYVWSNGKTQREIFVNEPGTYICDVAIDNPSNGCSYQAVFEVLQDGCVDAIYLPSAFTPFGDGLNDSFGPVIVGEEIEVTGFTIYDRWGERLFHSKGEFWDGTVKGKLVQIGVYVYTLQYTAFGHTKTQTGSVTVLNSRSVR